MISEKMLQFMMLSEIFKTTEDVPEELDDAYNNMFIRYKKLRDEFINEFNYQKQSKNPIKGTKQDA